MNRIIITSLLNDIDVPDEEFNDMVYDSSGRVAYG